MFSYLYNYVHQFHLSNLRGHHISNAKLVDRSHPNIDDYLLNYLQIMLKLCSSSSGLKNNLNISIINKPLNEWYSRNFRLSIIIHSHLPTIVKVRVRWHVYRCIWLTNGKIWFGMVPVVHTKKMSYSPAGRFCFWTFSCCIS